MRAAVCTGYGPPEVLQIRTVPAFFLSRLKVRKGQRLLVYGASGRSAQPRCSWRGISTWVSRRAR